MMWIYIYIFMKGRNIFYMCLDRNYGKADCIKCCKAGTHEKRGVMKTAAERSNYLNLCPVYVWTGWLHFISS
jgi:hypothetical protein